MSVARGQIRVKMLPEMGCLYRSTTGRLRRNAQQVFLAHESDYPSEGTELVG